MRLADGIHLVGSGSAGFDLTDEFDCHVYLVDGGDEAALVDSGIGASVEDVLANVTAAGVALERLRYALLTHAHPDHAGGAAALSERLPALRVLASAEVAAWVRAADEEAISVANGKRAGFYPADYRFRPAPVAGELRDGDRVRVGSLVLEVVETPGHAAGHLSFLVVTAGRRALFAGDLLFYGGRISLAANWDCRLDAYAASVRKVAELAVDALLPGHHSLSLQRGHRHADAANRLFAAGFVPPSVV